MNQGYWREKKGQSLVETAIILPIILILIMGIIDFGLLFNNYILISNAAREGARNAALGGEDALVVQTVQNMTTALDITKMTITISPGYSSRNHGVGVSVTVTYKNTMLTPLIDKFFPGGIATLKSTSMMRVE